MSVNKYADLPDIDTAPDIYETEDPVPSNPTAAGASDDEDSIMPSKTLKQRQETSGREELDYSNLIGTEEASKKFRKAEKKRGRKTLYTYPPSPDSPGSPVDPSSISRSVPLSHRLRALQSELTALEQELADPTNPALQRERDEENVDTGELFRGVVDVRSRLDKIRKGKEGRAKLVETVLETKVPSNPESSEKRVEPPPPTNAEPSKTELHTMVDLDSRLGALENLVGSSSTALDETSLLPSPLLPLINRLNSQLAILTQPRHIDSISRRLKLLISDLDRASAAQVQAQRKNPSQPSAATPMPNPQEQLLPMLTRLGPLLPHIPHILTRLRTLSTLHANASEFQTAIQDLEEEQKKLRSTLVELDTAVKAVEGSLSDNREVVKENVAGLENRVNSLLERLEDLRHNHEDLEDDDSEDDTENPSISSST
ncbi:hypothetical protein CVT24_009689 [Panaeolus cyanescens]|uniref:Dynamitin n=1 Tax=Panaeolus cyanescens TaxID=181874 RepID=A0A409Y9E0_9AGAR|nr:hypothetical protein CVT24_009689 [Panaeolus cyanescens]